jgi:HD-like signal output (HDOD) protein
MDGTNRRDPRYGKGSHEIEEVLVEAPELAARLRATFEAPGYRPPLLPPVALQLLALSQRPNVEVDEVAAMLEKDPLLTARILKLVRSPMYLAESPIRSIKQAIVRLGLRAMRDVVIEAAFEARVLKVPLYSEAMERLRRHSIATAHLSRLVSRFTPMEAEFAFLCGLLHDVGIACSLLALAEAPRGEKRPELSLAWPAIDALHEEASGIIARLWNLPPDVQHVVAHHHQIQSQGFVHPLSAVVCLGGDFADRHSLGVIAPGEARVDQSGEATLARAREELRLGDAPFALIAKEAADVVARLRFAP